MLAEDAGADAQQRCARGTADEAGGQDDGRRRPGGARMTSHFRNVALRAARTDNRHSQAGPSSADLGRHLEALGRDLAEQTIDTGRVDDPRPEVLRGLRPAGDPETQTVHRFVPGVA